MDWNGQENFSLYYELWVGTNDFNTKKNVLVHSNPRIIFLSGNYSLHGREGFDDSGFCLRSLRNVEVLLVVSGSCIPVSINPKLSKLPSTYTDTNPQNKDQ